ncbi:MAG: biopolymer transporter ExbD [Paludibacteraceae bacterium]|nr:biopolymer transporter ExbD [Paludibacteraceae bacterium]HHT61215.1 biopolymer transporter ExbD [Bacteroidales bacterium]MBP9038708.1 biopolymer transporter ExbD [Paludibacteraceae bacterium]HOA46271.1 biopolymer transporter ExbD [Paludibacteraceae bacterium]HOG36115.1 biopolymer transporter ExbD [Paludibacteraceae bacterium]
MMLKKRNKVSPSFSMSSMTDIVFLLLLFFMIASTMSSPNDLKINLPQSKTTTATKAHIVKVGIDGEGHYFVADDGEKPIQVEFEEIEPYLKHIQAADSAVYVALHADENVPYKEIVRILDIASENRLKLVIATKIPDKTTE